MIYANENILATLLSTDENKINQLEKVGNMTWNLTSDDGLMVTVEVMEKHIIRYTLDGTRSGIRFCWSVDEQKIIRQPRGLKRNPLFKPDSFHTFAFDVVDKARQRRSI